MLRAIGVAVALLTSAGIARAFEITIPDTTARVAAAGWIDGLAVANLGGPRERPHLLAEVGLQARITRILRTQLTLRGQVGGPFERGHPGIMSLVHEFQNHTPSAELNEAWADLHLGKLDVRTGIQKFAWGKLDGGPPTDVLTPRDLHELFERDLEEGKIGIPAVAATYALPQAPSLALHDLRATLVYVPLAIPSRLPLPRERWFPPSVVNQGFVIPERRAERLVNGFVQHLAPGAPFVDLDGPLRIPIGLRTVNARSPATLAHAAIAFRLAGTARDVDWSVMHYTGPETGPDGLLESVATCRMCASVVRTGKLPIRVHSSLVQRQDTIHMTGADASTVFGSATLRAEVAVFQKRPYLRNNADLVAEALTPAAIARYGGPLLKNGRARIPLQALFPDRDSVEWGIGADYFVGGMLPLVQLNQVVFLDRGPELLLADPDTRLLFGVRRTILDDRLELEFRTVYAFERGAWFVHPRAAYRVGDHWRLRVGYLAIGGPLASLIGQFRANDEFVFEARYIF